MVYNLKDILALSEKGKTAIPAFNIFGYEDTVAVIRAAEAENKPVILMVNRVAANHMDLFHFGNLLIREANRARVPVCIHLDHAVQTDAIKKAITVGFSSVMIDASNESYDDNVAITKEIVACAHPYVSVEAEIGSVAYSGQDQSNIFTEPEEAQRFAEETGVDALAVSVGTIHRMVKGKANLQFDLLNQISQRVQTPLVIHGSTGVSDDDLVKLVKSGAQKFNFGTVLRLAFGQTLRRQLMADPERFDRIDMFPECMDEVQEKAAEKIRLIT